MFYLLKLKGDERDNSGCAMKLEFGTTWANKAGCLNRNYMASTKRQWMVLLQ